MPHLCCRGGIRTMMITGDYHQTAVAVAWGVGMVPAGGVVHVIDKLPAAAEVSPPSSPVQLASTNSLFSRELDDFSRRGSQAWSSSRPLVTKLSGTTTLEVFRLAARSAVTHCKRLHVSTWCLHSGPYSRTLHNVASQSYQHTLFRTCQEDCYSAAMRSLTSRACHFSDTLLPLCFRAPSR